MGDFKGSQGILPKPMCVEKVAFFSTQKKCVPESFTFSVRISVILLVRFTACSDDPKPMEIPLSGIVLAGWIAFYSDCNLCHEIHSTACYHSLPHI